MTASSEPSSPPSETYIIDRGTRIAPTPEDGWLLEVLYATWEGRSVWHFSDEELARSELQKLNPARYEERQDSGSFVKVDLTPRGRGYSSSYATLEGPSAPADEPRPLPGKAKR